MLIMTISTLQLATIIVESACLGWIVKKTHDEIRETSVFYSRYYYSLGYRIS